MTFRKDDYIKIKETGQVFKVSIADKSHFICDCWSAELNRKTKKVVDLTQNSVQLLFRRGFNYAADKY